MEPEGKRPRRDEAENNSEGEQVTAPEPEQPSVSNANEALRVAFLTSSILSAWNKAKKSSLPTSPPRLPCAITAPKYKMDNEKRGICFIFCQTKFEFGKPLEENTKDAAKLLEVFGNLGFKVLLYENSTVAQIKSRLLYARRQDYRASDCVVVCVLSHGNGEVISVQDGEVPAAIFWENFVATKCASLIGKPKIFLIDTCQGLKKEKYVLVKSNKPALGYDFFGGTYGWLVEWVSGGGGDAKYVVPNHADITVFFSSWKGYVSYGDEEDGSEFISSFTEILGNTSKKDDLLSLFTDTIRMVMVRNSKPPKPGRKAYVQTPQIISTLTKKIYFRE